MTGKRIESATANSTDDRHGLATADAPSTDSDSPGDSTDLPRSDGGGAFSWVVRVVASLAGTALIGFAAVLLFAPQEVESVVSITAIARSPAIADEMVRGGLFVALGVGCALWVLLTRPAWADRQSVPSSPDDEDLPRFETLRSNPPEVADTTPVVGASLDNSVERLVAATRSDQTDSIRTQLRSLTADALVTVDGLSRQEAQTRLDEGTWTDDTVAAAYLADREAALSRRQRLVAWLQPARTKRRRIERTTNAIATRFDTGSDQLATGEPS